MSDSVTPSSLRCQGLIGSVTLTDMMLIGRQIRAARALLGWEQRQLAEDAGVSVATVRRLERFAGPVSAYVATVEAIRNVLEAAGIEFTNGDAPGVRLRRQDR